jgi:hypothetical protein
MKITAIKKIIPVLVMAFVSCAAADYQLEIPLEFSGMELKTGGKIPSEIRQQLLYAESINAYHFEIQNRNTYFKDIYFWKKNNRVIKIRLENSTVTSKDYNEEDCAPEKILEICENLYGGGTVSPHKPFSGTNPVLNQLVTVNWRVNQQPRATNNISIEYTYLPKENFEKIKHETTGYTYWYTITYTLIQEPRK